MATFNKMIAIGNLARDPEIVDLSNGGKVASFTIAINNRKQNRETGEWENDPAFIECKVFNGSRNLADRVQEKLGKGDPCMIEARVVQERWTDKETGTNRSRLVFVCFDVQKLERAPANRNAPGSEYDESHYGGQPQQRPQQRPQQQEQPQAQPQQTYGGEQKEEDIPF